jgi:hypothetical protein
MSAEHLMQRLRDMPDVEERGSQFGDMPAFWIDGREFVHFHDDRVEIRLTRKLINRLDEPRAPARARTSDWVMVDTSEPELAIELARQALEANRRR